MKIEHVEKSLESQYVDFGKDGTGVVLKEEGIKTFFIKKKEDNNYEVIAKIRLKVIFPGAKSLPKGYKAGKYNNPMEPSNGKGFTTHRYKNILYASDGKYRDFSSQFSDHPENASNVIKTALLDNFIWDNMSNLADEPAKNPLPLTTQLSLF